LGSAWIVCSGEPFFQTFPESTRTVDRKGWQKIWGTKSRFERQSHSHFVESPFFAPDFMPELLSANRDATEGYQMTYASAPKKSSQDAKKKTVSITNTHE
jgi:hypothetical protein